MYVCWFISIISIYWCSSFLCILYNLPKKENSKKPSKNEYKISNNLFLDSIRSSC